MKIFNRNLGWYDIKTKFKQLIRSIFYLSAVRSLICWIIFIYLQLVFFTSRVKFVGFENAIDLARNKKSIIFSFWHNRLVLMPFMARHVSKKSKNNYEIMSLSSKHGDGKFIGIIMTMFGFKNISGSTQDGRKPGRGIDLKSMRDMIRELKKGTGLGITPDGPKGPNQKINSQIIDIAKISGANILPTSYSSSRFIQFNSWDKLRLPLPFSKVVFFAGEVQDNFKINNNDLENVMNDAQEKSEELLKTLF